MRIMSSVSENDDMDSKTYIEKILKTWSHPEK